MIQALDEPPVVADYEDVFWQFKSALDLVEIEGLLHDLAQHEVLVKFLAKGSDLTSYVTHLRRVVRARIILALASDGPLKLARMMWHL